MEPGVLEPGELKGRGNLETPYGRYGVHDDLAGCADFLASDDSDYIVGHTMMWTRAGPQARRTLPVFIVLIT